jgi:uncharacterized protein (DUF305 family)
MTDTEPAPTTRPSPRPDGNDTDIHYLEDTRAALAPIMRASSAAASRGSRPEVRDLARVALSVQADQLAAIGACLTAWGRPDVAARPTATSQSSPAHRGPLVDRVFVDQLSDHAHAALRAARTEMVSGASRAVRLIAEDAIHAQDRQLAALTTLSLAVAHERPDRDPRPDQRAGT